jgi:hypothetical protein
MTSLPTAVDTFLHKTNPWWENKPGPVLPPYRRWVFNGALKKMEQGLAPITTLRGPRQVGKTTLQLQLIEHLLTKKSIEPQRILRVQFDEIPLLQELSDPILSIAWWFEQRILGRTYNEAARAGKPAYLLLDEVQTLADWAPQVKTLVDHHTLKMLVTGSSALRIEAGRDSLAGRIAQVELGTLLLREIAGLRFGEHIEAYLPENGLEALLQMKFWRDLSAWSHSHLDIRNRAFAAFSERGGYPVAQAHPDVPWPEVADQLNDTVIERAIQHDLRVGQRGLRRDPQLLREVYRLACRYAGQAPGQSVFVPEIQQALTGNIGWQRILAYLRFLDSTLLLKLIAPLELRLKKRKGNDKICICDHGLRASWLQEVIPIEPNQLAEAPHLQDLAGHLAESIVGYYLSGLPHLDLAHFPERAPEPEVDFILTIGERRIPLEVKYRRRIDPLRDTVGLRRFLERAVNNAPFAILVTMTDDVDIPDPRIIPVSLPSLLLMR